MRVGVSKDEGGTYTLRVLGDWRQKGKQASAKGVKKGDLRATVLGLIADVKVSAGLDPESPGVH